MSEEIPPSTNAPASAPSTGTAAPPQRKPRRRVLRRVLLVLGPLVVVAVGAYVYFTGGRYVSTDNAYVKADVVVVSARVAGPISSVAVRENQPVAAGDVLFTIDDRPFRVALDRANAQLGAIKDLVESFRASYRQQQEQLALARTNAAYEQKEYERLSALQAKKLASEVDVDNARHKRDVANQEISVAQRGLEQISARLGGDLDRPVTEQAAFLAAKSMRDSADLDLEHTVVRAPFDGIAAKVPMLGQYVAPGGAVMTVVANSGMWIEANYKETDLTHVTPGQRVSIKLDTYPDHEWRGTVQSISQATGAEFSVLPPQNASGNWVKVIQRIPVRIAVDTQPNDPELRVGMSAEIDIDTGHQREAPAFLSWLLPARAPLAGGDATAASGARARVDQ